MANVLVLGSGGREHALCWKLAQSTKVEKLYCAPGNAGIANIAECVDLPGVGAITEFCDRNAIALVMVGPEQPLVDGWVDQIAQAGIPVCGPDKMAAQLEGSKDFTKKLCDKYNIPTAAYQTFDDIAAAKAYIADKATPIVIKADGLAAGKGVIIAESHEDGEKAIDELLAKFDHIVIEEFMEGEEVSIFALCDGETAVPFGFAQDHKRVFDGDKGPNTGGMGAYSPAPVLTEALYNQVFETVINPSIAGMKADNAPFKGVLFAGLILTKDGPKLLEYNTRFGDPETQCLMLRYEGDLYELLYQCATGTLKEHTPSFSNKAAVCVVMATEGYPGAYEKNSEIKNLDQAASVPGVEIFHAGTKADDGKILAIGGRVLGITALADTIQEAQAKAYQAVDLIDWPEGFCRRDIAFRALS